MNDDIDIIEIVEDEGPAVLPLRRPLAGCLPPPVSRSQMEALGTW
jgi:hypothetical protein